MPLFARATLENRDNLDQKIDLRSGNQRPLGSVFYPETDRTEQNCALSALCSIRPDPDPHNLIAQSLADPRESSPHGTYRRGAFYIA